MIRASLALAVAAAPAAAQVRSVATAMGPVAESWGGALAGSRGLAKALGQNLLEPGLSIQPAKGGQTLAKAPLPRHALLAPMALALESKGHSPEIVQAMEAGARDALIESLLPVAKEMVRRKAAELLEGTVSSADLGMASSQLRSVEQLEEAAAFLGKDAPLAKRLAERRDELRERRLGYLRSQAAALARERAASGEEEPYVDEDDVVSLKVASTRLRQKMEFAGESTAKAETEAVLEQFRLFDAAKNASVGAKTVNNLWTFPVNVRKQAAMARSPNAQLAAIHEALKRITPDEIVGPHLVGVIAEAARNARTASVAQAAFDALDEARKKGGTALGYTIDSDMSQLLALREDQLRADPPPAPPPSRPARAEERGEEDLGRDMGFWGVAPPLVLTGMGAGGTGLLSWLGSTTPYDGVIMALGAVGLLGFLLKFGFGAWDLRAAVRRRR